MRCHAKQIVMSLPQLPNERQTYPLRQTNILGYMSVIIPF